MWNLLGALHQNGLTQLLSCHVHQMLPELVTTQPNILYVFCLSVFYNECVMLENHFSQCAHEAETLENLYRNTKSESCPFCRGNIKRVNSQDLWVLTCNDDVVDTETVSKEDLLRFYLYINRLPKDCPDSLFFVYYEYLF